MWIFVSDHRNVSGKVVYFAPGYSKTSFTNKQIRLPLNPHNITTSQVQWNLSRKLRLLNNSLCRVHLKLNIRLESVEFDHQELGTL